MILRRLNPSITGRRSFRTPLGQALSITKRPQARLRILLSIHLDTVYPPDGPFQTVTQKENGKLGGPGVADAKGGLAIMLTALDALERLARGGSPRLAGFAESR